MAARRKTPLRPSQRPLRVGEELRHALMQLLGSGEIHDPALTGLVLTVTEVRMSPDLRNATVYFTPLGGKGANILLKALKRAEPFIRARLTKDVNLRTVPKYWFELDGSFDAASRIEAVLKAPEVQRDLVKPVESDAESDPD